MTVKEKAKTWLSNLIKTIDKGWQQNKKDRYNAKKERYIEKINIAKTYKKLTGKIHAQKGYKAKEMSALAREMGVTYSTAALLMYTEQRSHVKLQRLRRESKLLNEDVARYSLTAKQNLAYLKSLTPEEIKERIRRNVNIMNRNYASRHNALAKARLYDNLINRAGSAGEDLKWLIENLNVEGFTKLTAISAFAGYEKLLYESDSSTVDTFMDMAGARNESLLYQDLKNIANALKNNTKYTDGGGASTIIFDPTYDLIK